MSPNLKRGFYQTNEIIIMDNLPSAYPKGAFFAPADEEKELRRRRGEGGKNDALGIITKSYANRHQSDFDKVANRATKFVLRDLACKWLTEKVVRDKDNHPEGYQTYVHRVNYCSKRRIDKNKGVFVYYNEGRQQAHYGNLVHCGSAWTCADCATKITEVRKKEVKQGIDYWRSQGGFVYLLTLTNRHHKGDDLPQLLQGQAKALVKFWSQRAVYTMLKAVGYVGRIVATEVTWSYNNGWHPHFHILMFFDHELINGGQGLRTYLANEWINACKKAGLKLPSLEHGCDLQDGSYADQYVSKWGLESEITKGHLKKGKDDGMTPFDLLRQSVEMPLFGMLFREFADAFKGKRQLVWSGGLKKLLGIKKKSDDEIVNETDEQSIVVNELAFEVFQFISLHSMQADYLHKIELDWLDNGTRARDLVQRILEFEIDEINKQAQIE